MNGVVGLKPTHGRVSRRGCLPMSPTLDSIGPLTRTVRDCALMLGAIAGGDGDLTVIDEPVPNYAAALTPDLSGVRVGVERSYFFYDMVSDDVSEAVNAALLELERLGATLVEIDRIEHLELSVAAGMAVLVGDTSEWHQKLLREQARSTSARPGRCWSWARLSLLRHMRRARRRAGWYETASGLRSSGTKSTHSRPRRSR